MFSIYERAACLERHRADYRRRVADALHRMGKRSVHRVSKADGDRTITPSLDLYCSAAKGLPCTLLRTADASSPVEGREAVSPLLGEQQSTCLPTCPRYDKSLQDVSNAPCGTNLIHVSRNSYDCNVPIGWENAWSEWLYTNFPYCMQLHVTQYKLRHN